MFGTEGLHLSSEVEEFAAEYVSRHGWAMQSALEQIFRRYSAVLEAGHNLSERQFHHVCDIMTPGLPEQRIIPVGNDRRAVRRVVLNALFDDAEAGEFAYRGDLSEEEFKELRHKMVQMDAGAQVALTEAVELFWTPKD